MVILFSDNTEVTFFPASMSTQTGQFGWTSLEDGTWYNVQIVTLMNKEGMKCSR